MVVRTNIAFLNQDRFSIIDIKAYQDLCEILDYLISTTDQIGNLESSLNVKLMEL
jgi:hypothetical protein